jgi:hypothetical protein
MMEKSNLITEPVAEWYERWRCDHSEAVWAGSKPGACNELLGKKLTRTGASGLWNSGGAENSAPTRSWQVCNLPCLRVSATRGKYRAFQ